MSDPRCCVCGRLGATKFDTHDRWMHDGGCPVPPKPGDLENVISNLSADVAQVTAERDALRSALVNLYALVQGEAPLLLEDDHHDEMVRKALSVGGTGQSNGH